MDRSDLNLTSLIAGVTFIVLGFLFLLERLDVIDVSGRYVVPVLLIALGVGVVFGSRRGSPPPPQRDDTPKN
jgi:cell wall-active antibiotic response 4TMS protein YvqF